MRTYYRIITTGLHETEKPFASTLAHPIDRRFDIIPHLGEHHADLSAQVIDNLEHIIAQGVNIYVRDFACRPRAEHAYGIVYVTADFLAVKVFLKRAGGTVVPLARTACQNQYLH